MLLDRPQQYYREVVHHGKENKQSFKKNELNYKIQPFIEEDVAEKEESKTLLMSGKKLLKDMKKEEGVGYAILMKPRKEEIPRQSSIPEEVKQLRYKFKDIICEGTLATLAPKREINHQINFVLGASLPNKAAYKMTLEKNKEIARQVQELLDQGLSRKSITP